MRWSLKIAILIFFYLLPFRVVAVSELAEPPSFATLLVSEPIVVIATMIGPARQSSKTFLAQDDNNPAYSEKYIHFDFELKEALKGEVPSKFEIRQVADRKDQVQLEPGREVLIVLSPDVGKDAEGNLRRGYLISFSALFPVTENAISIPSLGGSIDKWTLQNIRDQLSSRAEEEERRNNTNTESLEASSAPVVNGEFERPVQEPKLPVTKTDRDTGLLSVERANQSKPRIANSPAE